MKNLTQNQLSELKSLVTLSLQNEENTKWSQKNGYNADNVFLPVNVNKPLAEFVNSITGYSLKDITSMHFIRYGVGQSLTRHKDETMLDIKNPDKSLSIVFMLNTPTRGGEFYLDDKLVEFNKVGQYVEFYGKEQYHEVKEVTEGVREVLVMWYRPKIKKSVL